VWDFGCAGGKRRDFGRAYGGAGGPERLGLPALLLVVFRKGSRLGKIPAEDILKIEPDRTIIGGEVIYTKPAGGM
jgi:hypothetical protein